MQRLNRKTTAIAVTLLMILTIAIPLAAIPTVNAGFNNETAAAVAAGMHWPPPGPENAERNASATRLLLWNRFKDQIPTWVFLTAAPNPVGVGQRFNLVMFNPQVPPGALIFNDVVYQYTIDVVKPNGATEKLPSTGTFVSDSTGAAYTTYIPDQTGNYSFTVKFHELFYRWYYDTTPGSAMTTNSTYQDYYGTTFKESTYTLKVTVQEDPVSLVGLPNIPPLPTEYWTRPIEGQNTEWYRVSSNWLNNCHDRDNGGNENRYQPDGIAPESAHILWTRPTEDNGVVGGNDLSRPGNVFNAGSQYQPRFVAQVIMYGRLYYSPNIYTRGAGDLLDCVDLRTGELLWEVNTTALVGQSFQQYSLTTEGSTWFGYYYSQDDPNEHGIQNPGWLFSVNYARALQPERGIVSPLRINNVPSGFEIQGPAGENLRYVLTNLGTSANPNYYLAQWNSSKVIPMITAGSDPTSTAIDASLPSRYDWNVSFPIKFTTAPTIRAAKLGDILFGSNGSWPTGTSGPSYAYPDEVTIWAVSLKPGSIGQLIYMKNIDVDDAQRNTNIMFERASADEGVCVAIEVPNCKFIGYSIYDGTKLWETDSQSDGNPYGYFTWPSLISRTQTKLAYGMLYTGGYTGWVTAYNLTNGNIVWRNVYPSGGEKIQNYVQMIGLVCDGKLYVGTHEHSADTPLYKGERLHCLNATTGEEIWNLSGWVYPSSIATADGVLIYWNNYDAQIYAIGKGPTATTVSAPDVAAPFGTPVVIKGTVMDISAGTKQKEQAARFPNGVAAVSEASMTEWMEYVYMQKARPSNATGVEVTLSVIDANNNCREIGKTTSDANGFYSFEWTPDIPGKYTVIATFAGSEGYWPSQAEDAFTVMQEPASTPAPTPMPESIADVYFVPAVIGIIIAIAVVGAITILMLRKRP
ncbi:PQQ-binding-like beta-propeller repeat protein [Candidatus Bathyarchaeota archaeon A05DMB-2]|jgi:outer membrane protein assembly factor BamB|nr:PQQ-binding-like beta-propeller repeat protein [Candidatus Bathyarchaeota archaeon A05DMB-2]